MATGKISTQLTAVAACASKPAAARLADAAARKARQFRQEGAAQAAALLKTIGNEQRLLVLCLLIEHGEMTVGALLDQVDLSQSALSQHLARMREEGLVTFRREAQTLHYSIVDPNVEKLIAALKRIFCP